MNAFVQKVGLLTKSNKSDYTVLHEVFICLCTWTVKPESLDGWGWCDLGTVASWR